MASLAGYSQTRQLINVIFDYLGFWRTFARLQRVLAHRSRKINAAQASHLGRIARERLP
jgi:hypothetical protein